MLLKHGLQPKTFRVGVRAEHLLRVLFKNTFSLPSSVDFWVPLGFPLGRSVLVPSSKYAGEIATTGKTEQKEGPLTK